MGAWVKGREAINRARKIRSEELREHQYRGGYDRCFENKIVEWNEDSNVEQVWEQVKWAMVENIREVFRSVMVLEITKGMCGGIR